jgi:lysozyme
LVAPFQLFTLFFWVVGEAHVGWCGMVKRKLIFFGFSAFIIGGVVLAILFYNGIFLLNNPSEQKYPVRGVDVSSYQGEIDWNTLANHNIQFAFIKATEGSSYIDEYYAENYENAIKTNLRVGAYHFFSYDSPGKTQAQNFISVVLNTDDLLPPVIDVEFYGDKERNPPDHESVRQELSDLLLALEEHYGKKPIIYATEKSYELYIAESFMDYDLWIRNVFSRPSVSNNRSWTFWQYTNREVLDGYVGKEKYIDMNVFCGTQEEFDNYAK